MTRSFKVGRIAAAVALSIGMSTAVMANTTTSSIRGNVVSEAGNRGRPTILMTRRSEKKCGIRFARSPTNTIFPEHLPHL